MENNYYIYFHINPLKNQVFYVGKGSGKRAWIKSNRSDYWKRYVKKYGYIVDITDSGLSEEEAFAKEKFYINFFGRKDLGKGVLINLTDGGEGQSGNVFDIDTRLKISKKLTGNSNGSYNGNDFRNTPVIQFDKTGNYIKEFKSIKEAQIETKTFQISKVCSGKRKTSGGFIWKYKN